MPAASPTDSAAAHFDVLVVGAGFGGLGTALRLAERGVRVALRERLAYPGGCASTFRRSGYRFEAGATLFSGFAEHQLFARWIERHQLDVGIDWLDPVVEFRTPDWRLAVPRSREQFIERFLAFPDAPADRLRAFFAQQKQVADALWGVLDDPDLLPPFGLRALLTHARRAPTYLPLVKLAGKPLRSVVHAHGLEGFRPLTSFLDALCQITVQCGLDEAEAPFALSTLDYYFRGTGHVRGGIGKLATALTGAVSTLGGDVRLADEVRSITREGDGFRVVTRKGELWARRIVANVLPRVTARLLGSDLQDIPRLRQLAADVRKGWGACMLYLVAREPEGVGASAHHVEMVQDEDAPYVEGNHLFCSIGGADAERAPPGFRTLTVSTHLPMEKLLALDEGARAAYVAEVQDHMRSGLRTLLPEWAQAPDAIVYDAPASPRTFERFTGRPDGFVGGIPRRAGLGNYRGLLPRPVVPGVYLVGDTVFPGQSTLATALGGYKLADHLARR